MRLRRDLVLDRHLFARGWSEAELADRMGWSRQRLNLRRASNRWTLQELERLAGILGVQVREIAEEDEA